MVIIGETLEEEFFVLSSFSDELIKMRLFDRYFRSLFFISNYMAPLLL